MENELSRVVDALPGIVWTARPDGQVEFLNQTWCEHTGLTIERSCGAGWQDAVHPDDLRGLLAGWQPVQGAKAPVDARVRLRGQDGTYRKYLFRARPSVDAFGQVAKWCGLATDIGDQIAEAEGARHSTEAASGHGEDDSLLILDNIPGIVLFMTPDGELEFANRTVTGYFGKSLAELKRWAEDDTIHPEDRPHIVEVFRRAIASGQPYKFEGRFRSGTGTYRWFKCRGIPSRDAAGRIVRWRAVGIDIEDQKRAEALLAGEKRLLEMVANDRPLSEVLESLCRHVETTASGSSCSIVLVDPSGTKLQEAIAPSLAAEFNDAVRGWPLERLGGPCQVAARDKTQIIMSDVVSDVRWRTSWRGLAQKHGLRSCWSTPIVSRAGKVLGTFALYQREPGTPNERRLELIEQFRNIASIAIERARRDDSLRQSEARLADAERDLQLMIDTIPIFVAAYQPDGTRSFVNRTWQEYMGLSLEEATGPDARTFSHFHPDDDAALDEAWRASLANGQPFFAEARIRRADGQYRWHTSHRVPLRAANGNIVRWYSVGIDIEDRKRAEEALRDSELSLRSVIDGIPGLVGVLAPDGQVEAVNRRIIEYCGRSLDELKNWGTNGTVHEEDLPQVAEVFGRSIASGVPYQIEQRLRRFDGSYLWFDNRGIPISDEAGHIVRWYVLLTDIDERKRAEEKAVEADRELQRLIDNIPVQVSTFGADGNYLYVNKRSAADSGLGTQDLQGDQWRRVYHPDDVADIERDWNASLASGDPMEREVRRRMADGTYRWHLIRRVPGRDENGIVVRWYAVGIDIEDRKRAEDKAVEAERELQATIDSIPALIASYWPNGDRDLVNLAWQRFTGTSQDEARGKAYLIPVSPDGSGAEPSHVWQRCLETGEPFELEERLQRADGEYRWHWVRRVPVRDDNGKIIKWYGIGHDIEDRKRAEEALRRSEAQLKEAQRELQLTIDSIPAMVATYEPDGTRTFVNKQWQDYTDRTSEEATGSGRHVMRQFHPDESEEVERAFWNSLATGEALTLDLRIKRADGEYRWHTHQSVPLRDEKGEVVKWYATEVDIEDKKRAASDLVRSEARLADAEHELRLTLDSIPTITWRAAPNGYVQRLNKQWFEYTGTTHEQVRGWRWKLCVHPDDLDQLVEAGNRYVTTGQSIDCEARLRRHDGEYRWFLFRPAPTRDEAGNVIAWYGTITDIEDRKRAEEALAASESNLKRIIDTIPALVWSARLNGSAEFCNQSYVEYTGLPLEQLQNWGYSNAVHPADVDEIGRAWRAIRASGRTGETEARLRRKDGEYRWFMFRATPLRDANGNPVKWFGVGYDIEDRKRAEQALRRSETLLAEGQRISSTGTFSWRVDTDELTFSEELCRIFELDPNVTITFEQIFARIRPEDRPGLSERMKLIRSGRGSVEQELRLTMPDGTIKFLRSVGQMVQHQDRRQEYLGAIQDITPRRRAEESLDRVRSELAHVSRAMSLGALTASIAHEVNQPLAGIVTNASTCLRMLAADPPNVDGARETARRTIRDGNRAADVIARLRALFRKKGAVTEDLDLNDATREVVALVFSDLLRNRVILQMELGEEPLPITGDRTQLQQVILNLVRNASDAMSEVNDRPRQLVISAERKQDGGARLSVRDSGVGLEPQSAERLFDAFFTTKGDGMGIGLSVSRSIIESHGGRLWAEANDGPGATFSFSIPRRPESAGDEGAAGAIWTRPTTGAHDHTRNA
jgi:PAS domain S-box-containing protein